VLKAILSVHHNAKQRLGPINHSRTGNSVSTGKWQILTPQRAKTPEPILMKLGMVDYIRVPTTCDNFGGGSATWVVWANR